MPDLTDIERERLRHLTHYCLDQNKNELQRLAQRLLEQEAEKSLRLAKLSTAQDEAFIALKKQLDAAEGHIREIPKYFRCERCGQAPSFDGTWRWFGPVPYEHKCPDIDPRCGYFPARLIERGEGDAPEPKEKGLSPLMRAIVSGLAAGVGVAVVHHLPGPFQGESRGDRWIVQAPRDCALYPECSCSCGATKVPRDALSVCSAAMGLHVRTGECDPSLGPGGVRIT
jgi:hypothetical protein